MTGDRKGKLKNQHKKHGKKGKIGLLNSHALCVFFYCRTRWMEDEKIQVAANP